MPNNSKNAFLGQTRTRLRYLGTHLAPRHKKTPKLAGFRGFYILEMAGVTGLEPAASGVTGRRSNQLSYTP